MIRRLLTFLLWLLAMAAHADARLDRLISEGNRSYELGQHGRIKECADSVRLIISEAGIDGDALIDYTASMLKLYGNYHYENGMVDAASYPIAEQYYNKVDSIITANPTTSFCGDMPTLILREKAQLYYLLGRYEEAVKALREADERMEFTYGMVGDDRWLLTKLSLALSLARVGDFDEAISIAESELGNAIDKENLAFAKARRMYAKILMLANLQRDGALKGYKAHFDLQKREAEKHFAEMNSVERQQYWLSLRPFMADCYRLEDADPAFLYDITLFSKGLLLQLSRLSGAGRASDQAIQSLNVTWRQIQKRLKPRQAAIEFVEYEKNGIQQMGALILKPVGAPKFIPLTPPAEILRLTEKELRSTDRKGKDDLYDNSQLQSLMWTPQLLQAIGDANRIYFAPDGYLHRLAIEYMPQVKDIEMFRLTSTRRLMEQPLHSAQRTSASLFPSDPMLMFGGINYDLNNDEECAGINDPIAFRAYRGVRFPRLSVDSDETQIIGSLRDNPSDSILSGSTASERAFRVLAPNFASIMVSTHGDFHAKALPLPNDLKPAEPDAAMSENVIAFSGINRALQRQDFPSEVELDGILSAEELSKLDLSKCKLFTMSACQTALGRITAEGVFGLQRGLKNAGAQAMLLSLWNVNSRATAELMKHFYDNLNQGLTIHKAFLMARQSLIAAGAESTGAPPVKYIFDPATMTNRPVTQSLPNYSSPQFTDAFILIDALD